MSLLRGLRFESPRDYDRLERLDDEEPLSLCPRCFLNISTNSFCDWYNLPVYSRISFIKSSFLWTYSWRRPSWIFYWAGWVPWVTWVTCSWTSSIGISTCVLCEVLMASHCHWEVPVTSLVLTLLIVFKPLFTMCTLRQHYKRIVQKSNHTKKCICIFE